ncbi:hypothetical protein [Moorena sp. SIO3H5]|uniref:hypothetical protein n=1 Tax=Moorena sp. SIO3H5 TaxID=2607834 RepID=UPI0013BCF0EF|nr:hypothetical protein [Moorena sp. SIO3H5]NEO72334.1 hypothetical protein [Moorena sp. SIO3H5]
MGWASCLPKNIRNGQDAHSTGATRDGKGLLAITGRTSASLLRCLPLPPPLARPMFDPPVKNLPL